MNPRPRCLTLTLGILLLLQLAVSQALWAKSGEPKNNRKEVRKAVELAQEAADAFEDIMKAPDKGIPRDLLERAESVAVSPNVIKAAFIVGGSGGKGVVSRRTAGGWSVPAFFNLGGGSFGFQIGAAATDYVLLFMNDDALKALLKDKFELGGEVSVAAGPVGRTAAASTDLTMEAQILTYSRSRGVFAGVALKGAVISPDDDRNEAVYGKRARDFLLSQEVTRLPKPAGVEVFLQTLERYSPRKK